MSTQSNLAPSASEKRTAHRLSKDGKWRSFSRVPHLLQYVSSGTYFARIKVHGKIIREGFETDVLPTAQLRLLDFSKAKREPIVRTKSKASLLRRRRGFIGSVSKTIH
jgi:hypothetical protein